MSLLLDALKKAALEKERRESGAPSQGDGASKVMDESQKASNEDPADQNDTPLESNEQQDPPLGAIDQLSTEVLEDIPSLTNEYAEQANDDDDLEIEVSSDDFSDLTLDVDFDDLENSDGLDDQDHLESADELASIDAELTVDNSSAELQVDADKIPEESKAQNYGDLAEGNDFGEVVGLDEELNAEAKEDAPIEASVEQEEESPTLMMGEPVTLSDDEAVTNKAQEEQSSAGNNTELSVEDSELSIENVEPEEKAEQTSSDNDVNNPSDTAPESATNSDVQNGGVNTKEKDNENPEGNKGAKQDNNAQQDDEQLSGYQRITDREAKTSFFQLLGRSQKAVAIDKKKKMFQLLAFSAVVFVGVIAYAYFVIFHSSPSSSIAAQNLPPPSGYFENPSEEDIANQIAEASAAPSIQDQIKAAEAPMPNELPVNAGSEDSVQADVPEATNDVNGEISSGNSGMEAPVEDSEVVNVEQSPAADPTTVQAEAEEFELLENANANSSDPTVTQAPATTDQATNVDAPVVGGMSKPKQSDPVNTDPPVQVVAKTEEELKAEAEAKAAEEAVKEAERKAEQKRQLKKLVNKGYNAFNRGNLSRARKTYQDALEIDENDRDALLGAAAVAVSEQRFKYALVLYKKRLAQVPSDQHARAGLLALLTNKSAGPEIQSDIELLAQEFPEQAYIHFVKGNFYASQEQWLAANAAYGMAYELENINANYAYNFAISFEYLSQFQKAKEYYVRALMLSKRGTAAFDINMLQSRIQYLQGK